MNKNPSIAVLIVAAGSGERMQSEMPKQYMTVNGKTVLRHTIDVFQRVLSPQTRIQCVISDEHADLYEKSVEGCGLLPPTKGGGTRQQSVYNGLMALESYGPDIVLIHDAARPCVTPDDITAVLETLKTAKAATLAMPVSETLRKGDTIIPRDGVMLVQTPQGFDFNMIADCHRRASTDGYQATDDTSLASYYGYDVVLVSGGRHNLKITTQDDLMMAHALLASKTETRIGSGFDVHAFADEAATHIRLCGVDIPFNRSLSGHSDADVGLHAITDAIFGVMGDGDIGSHFPPTNMNYKNMDSHVFLDKSVDNLRMRGGKIIHIDVTFMCEKPKIGKHREEIVNHLAKHLDLSTGRISVKATTTERLGFTGREEGIACHAIVTAEVLSDD